MHARGTAATPLAPKPSVEQYRKQSKELLQAAHAAEGQGVRDWATRLYPREVDEITKSAEQGLLPRAARRPLKLADAQWFVAWLHGFESWPKLVHHVEGLEQKQSPVALFETAADAVANGDLAALQQLLTAHPELIHARSTRDHHATLLHYVAANGHEGFRQRTPSNAVDVARFLLDKGAEPDALADMYENQCTTMEMLVSSAHPHAGGVQATLAELLLDFGATINGVKDDGSPLMTALAFHYYDTAVTLVRRGARIDNVISAAALGRVDLVDRMVLPGGRLRGDVPLTHGPWPKPRADPAVHLGYALAWAATWGHQAVVELLLDRGVDPASRDTDGTALHAAAGYGHMDVARLLIAHGASLETHNSYGGTVLSATIWFARNAPRRGVDYKAVVRELIALGARTDAFPKFDEWVHSFLRGDLGPDSR